MKETKTLKKNLMNEWMDLWTEHESGHDQRKYGCSIKKMMIIKKKLIILMILIRLGSNWFDLIRLCCVFVCVHIFIATYDTISVECAIWKSRISSFFLCWKKNWFFFKFQIKKKQIPEKNGFVCIIWFLMIDRGIDDGGDDDDD